MAYYLERFGTVALPVAMSIETAAPVAAAERIVATVAGAFDADGAGRSAQRFPHTLTYQAIVDEATLAAQRTALDALRAAVGTRAYLYRRADNDDAIHRALCRLVAMPHEREFEHQGYLPIRLEFKQLAAWQGGAHGAWFLDSGEVLDDGLEFDEADYQWSIGSASTTETVTNEGNLPVSDAVITITAGTSALSDPEITGGGAHLTWTGTIAAGKALVIDCGALSVENNGVDAYSGFALGASHTIEEWLRLEPGDTDITLAISGTLTGATWAIAFRDRWA